jgi:hypothetical protein
MQLVVDLIPFVAKYFDVYTLAHYLGAAVLDTCMRLLHHSACDAAILIVSQTAFSCEPSYVYILHLL